MLNEIFECLPSVFAVGKEYQIFVPVKVPCLMWVRVGEECFYDHSNGILRSDVTTHKISIPIKALDKAREYTVCARRMIERKPYFPEVSDVMEYTSPFRPVPENRPIHIYHLADAHNRVEDPVSAGRYFGDELDLLVLNGDIPNHAGDVVYFSAIHKIASEITKGQIPVVFSRGNHDTRGFAAEKLEEYTPTDNGRSYFTFRLGSLWGIVLDCGEDKPDSHEEYGHTTCFEAFRKEETAFLHRTVQNAKEEYRAEGVRYRLVICHIPFSFTPRPPFNIETDTYTEWCRLLREEICADLMLSGHHHKCYLSEVGSSYDHKGQPCPLVVASRFEEGKFVGGAITLDGDTCHIAFTGNQKEVEDEYTISL